MGKSTPKAPPPPDPVATAAAQSQYNREAAITQANLNRIDQFTPQGNLTYQQVGKFEDGTPRYSQTQTLSPDEQAKYDQQNQIALSLGGLAGDNITRVTDAQSKPFTYDGMTPLTSSVNAGAVPKGGVGIPDAPNAGTLQSDLNYGGLARLPGTDDFGAEGRRVGDAVYGQATSRLDPQYQQQESDIRSRLAAQGISENSDAYRREMDNFSRAKTDAYNNANYSAIKASGDEQSRIFGLSLAARQQGKDEVDTQGNFRNTAVLAGDENQRAAAALAAQLQGQRFSQEGTAQNQQFNQDLTNANLSNATRQQQIQEATYLRNLPLNDIAALLGTGGGVTNPVFNNVAQVGVASPDYQGAVQSNYTNQMQAYQAAQANKAAGLGGIMGIAGSLGSAAIMASDRRLKTAIREIGRLANGIATYAFKYIGSSVQQFGVMAQDVLSVVPDAVHTDSSGYLSVDYSKVYG